MNQQRPVNLDLGSLKYPPMAIASILHRVSGLVLFLLLPVMLYFLRESLVSLASFEHLKMLIMTCALHKLVIWAFSSAWIYHLLAGVRHLLMDTGIGETAEAGRKSALIVIGLSVLASMAMGVCLWSAA
ncbi:MAG: succinate dehydrogenase, cytochrome b556 subunit [Gammaproteobacteria bacterium]|nr:succinate dehydrogenase, cytochrome b556 subunit [Gammaproteobacteria bacterium]